MSDSTLTAAGISAIVSILVAMVSYLTTRATLRKEIQQVELELQRKLTEKLYDKRIDLYPLAFAITDKIRGEQVFDQSLTSQDLQTIRTELQKWNGEHGFVMSDSSIKAFYSLRSALNLNSTIEPMPQTSSRQKIFDAKNTFRSNLRRDVHLLYAEENTNE